MPSAAGLSLEEFKARNRALAAASGQPLPDLDDQQWQWMQDRIPDELESALAESRDLEAKLAWQGIIRSNVANLSYLAGRTDTHPDVHGKPETLRADELCGRHLGITVRSLTYRSRKGGSLPDPGERIYVVCNIQHLKNGSVLVNGSWPYLTADTVLTVVETAGTKAA